MKNRQNLFIENNVTVREHFSVLGNIYTYFSVYISLSSKCPQVPVHKDTYVPHMSQLKDL